MRRKYFCEILGNYLSRKSGQKCCVYGQNGKPLSEETVKKFLSNLNKNLEYEFINDPTTNSISEFQKSRRLITWAANETYTKLFRLFYFKNVPLLTDFIKEIYQMDFKANIQQVPNVYVLNGELFKVELYTPSLKGLSFKDFQLAVAINSFNFNKYKLIPLKDELNYRREVRILNIEEERQKTEIGEGVITDRSKLKNKYDGLVYEKAYLTSEKNKSSYSSEYYNEMTEINKIGQDINYIPDVKINSQISNFNTNNDPKNNFDFAVQDFPEYPTSSGCSNPGGCACAQKASSKYN